METQGTILECGHPATETHHEFTTGYGVDKDGNRHCYACCAERERAAMIETGRATLYLTGMEKMPRDRAFYQAEVTDWPGKLRFKVWGGRIGRHNIAGVVYTGRFEGPDGKVWSFRQVGDNTQIAHCKRIKG